MSIYLLFLIQRLRLMINIEDCMIPGYVFVNKSYMYRNLIWHDTLVFANLSLFVSLQFTLSINC